MTFNCGWTYTWLTTLGCINWVSFDSILATSLWPCRSSTLCLTLDELQLFNLVLTALWIRLFILIEACKVLISDFSFGIFVRLRSMLSKLQVTLMIFESLRVKMHSVNLVSPLLKFKMSSVFFRRTLPPLFASDYLV